MKKNLKRSEKEVIKGIIAIFGVAIAGSVLTRVAIDHTASYWQNRADAAKEIERAEEEEKKYRAKAEAEAKKNKSEDDDE